MEFPNTYQNTFTLPTGATSGARIVFGPNANIKAYYADNRIAWEAIATSPGPNEFIGFDVFSDNAVGSRKMGYLSSGELILSNESANFTASLNASTNPVKPTINTWGLADAANSASLYIDDFGVQTGTFSLDYGGGWQTSVTFSNGWSGSVKYRIDGEDNIILQCAIIGPAAGVAAGAIQTAFTLPTPYRPVVSVPASYVALVANSSGTPIGFTAFGVGTSGAVVCHAATALGASDQVNFSALIPIGNLP